MHYPTIRMPHGSRWSRRSDTGSTMSIMWMALAFFGGAALGMVAGKKKMLMAGGESKWTQAWKHHHHGFGQSACHMKHASQQPAAPGATGESRDERDEGE